MFSNSYVLANMAIKEQEYFQRLNTKNRENFIKKLGYDIQIPK